MRVFVTGATGFSRFRHRERTHRRGPPSPRDGAVRMQAQSRLKPPALRRIEAIWKTWKACAAEQPRPDAVIHTAFRHDWSRFAESCELDKHAIEAIGAVIQGSSRPFHRQFRSRSGPGAAPPPRMIQRFPLPQPFLVYQRRRLSHSWSAEFGRL